MADTDRLDMTLVESTDTIGGSGGFKDKVNSALLKLDKSVGRVMCTSVTRPTTDLFPGIAAYETDTKRNIINPSGVAGNINWRYEGMAAIGSGPVRTLRPVRPYGQDSVHSAFPSVAVLLNGVSVMVYRQGTNHVINYNGVVRMATSTDQGRSWSAPTTIVTAPAGTDLRDPCVSLSRDGAKIYLTYFKANSSLAAAGVFFRTSMDGGTTWSAEVRVDSLPYAASSAPAFELDNGTIVVPYYGRSGAETWDSVWTGKSTDGGATFPTNTRVLNGQTATIHFQEPYGALKGQVVVMAFRYGNAFSIGTTVSVDNTANWTAGAARFGGSGRPTIFWANDSTLACIYRDLSTGNALIRTSRDNGTSWTPGRLVETSRNTGEYMTYAGVDRLADGSSLVVLSLQSSDTSARLYFTYAGEPGAMTPLGALPSQDVVEAANLDRIVFASNFDQPNGGLGYPWYVVAGSVTVTDGELQSASADNVPDFPVIFTGYVDMDIEADLLATGPGPGAPQTGQGIVFRMLSSTTYLMYTIETQGANIRIYKVVSGTATQLAVTAGFNYPFHAYSRWKVTARDREIRCFFNDTIVVSHVLSAPDQATFATGKFGGIKLNSQGSDIHKCRRLIIENP